MHRLLVVFILDAVLFISSLFAILFCVAVAVTRVKHEECYRRWVVAAAHHQQTDRATAGSFRTWLNVQTDLSGEI